jgi:hypothetical protein
MSVCINGIALAQKRCLLLFILCWNNEFLKLFQNPDVIAADSFNYLNVNEKLMDILFDKTVERALLGDSRRRDNVIKMK